MAGIGAELPPHLLAKRKRQNAEVSDTKAPSANAAKASIAPDPPSVNAQGKRPRVAGPAMPPAPIETMPRAPLVPVTDHDADDSDSSDDFGPAAPSSRMTPNDANDLPASSVQYKDTAGAGQEEPKLKRDEWMTMPPTQDNLASRMDPTRPMPRAFNTGKGARAPNTGGTDGSSWHETPEEKRTRLQNEMLGITGTVSQKKAETRSTDESRQKKIKEQIDKRSGPSLMDNHRQSKNLAEIEDDPSKRAFDREKDMGGGARISSAQKREMLNKASDFSGRFSGGSFL